MSLASTKIVLTNQEQAILNFFSQMDIESIDALLDNDKNFATFDKITFINKLKIVFKTIASHGDTYLIAIDGKCNSCNKGNKGYTFVGNNTNNYLSVIIETSNNKIDDIYDCTNFKNKKNNFILQDRFFIDNDLSIPF